MSAHGGPSSRLPDHPSGDYQYLPGISAFSCGTVARTGHEIVHVTLAKPVPWRAGFVRLERHLREHGRGRTALCGIELRSPAAFTFDGFNQFNAGYRSLLAEWGSWWARTTRSPAPTWPR